MSAEDASGFVTLVETIFQSNYCAISATALLLYDWIITLDREKAFVWSRRRSVASVLYIFGRLVGPSSYITSMFLFSAVSDQTCRVAILFEDVTSLFPYVFWAVFSGFRAHALSARNKAVAGVVLVLNLVPVGLNAYIYYFSQAVNYPPPLGCAQAYNGPNTSAAFISIISYCSRGSIILAECIVIALTWKETWSFRHAKHIAGETTATRCGRKSVGEVLLVNGTFCFGVSLVLNVLTLVFTNIGRNADQLVEIFAYFRDAITLILVSRFLLNLLELAGNEADAAYESSVSVLSTFVDGHLDDLFSHPLAEGTLAEINLRSASRAIREEMLDV